MKKLLQEHNSSLIQAFSELDTNNKGYLSQYDVEDLLAIAKRAKANEVIKDAQLLLNLYDKSGERKVSLQAFRDQLTPK